jgi:pyruvate dehydrogenase E1 component alpha subunit
MNKNDLIEFEANIARKFDDGYIPYMTHLCGGNEDQIIDIFKDIDEKDWVFSSHRNHYHYLLHTGKADRLEDLILNGKSMFVFDRERNFFTSSILAGTAAIAAGVALAIKRKGIKKHVWCFLGDGAEDEGNFYEAARYVEGHGLPCTYIIEDNDRSVIAGKAERWGTFSPVQFNCVKRYEYKPTWPHGGTGHGMIDFKVKAKIEPETLINYAEHDRRIEKYFDTVKTEMEHLAGYNVRHGNAYGSLRNIPESQLIETPVAENLMTGLGMGMTLEGIRTCVFFERQDFLYNAMDLLVNHADKINIISDNEFTFPIIVKAVKGGTYPFYAGITHTSDISGAMRRLFSFPVYAPKNQKEVKQAYKFALGNDRPTLICENKELY